MQTKYSFRGRSNLHAREVREAPSDDPNSTSALDRGLKLFGNFIMSVRRQKTERDCHHSIFPKQESLIAFLIEILKYGTFRLRV